MQNKRYLYFLIPSERRKSPWSCHGITGFFIFFFAVSTSFHRRVRRRCFDVSLSFWFFRNLEHRFSVPITTLWVSLMALLEDTCIIPNVISFFVILIRQRSTNLIIGGLLKFSKIRMAMIVVFICLFWLEILSIIFQYSFL